MLLVMARGDLSVPKKHSLLVPGGALVMMKTRIPLVLEW
jgi:hypothetical protein